jgi:hypothetical protein
MRKFIFKDVEGNRIEQKANSLVEAIRLSGAKIAGLQCGGDCGDCNEIRRCSAQEQGDI